MTGATAGHPLLEVLSNLRHLAGPRTGIEVYMEELVRALSSTGEVALTALTWTPLGLDLPRVREQIPASRPEIAAGSPRAVIWKLWFDLWGCLRTARRGDAVLYHGMDGFLPFALRPRDRCVATVHDLGWQVHPGLYSRRVLTMYRALFPWVVRRADRFIAVSRYTADDLIRRAGVAASKIDVVYHGLDPTFSAVASGERTAGGERSDEAPYVLAVGGVSPRKNTRRLVEAFSRWRGRGGRRKAHRLLITGTSLDHDFAREGALPEGVSLLGYVNKSELPGLYAGAAAFLYPGIYEGFGLPILEAMACGAPVVTSSTGAAPEVAGGAALIVDPFDVASIESGLEQATLPDEAARLRTLGHERARTFRWERAAQDTLAVYRRLRD